MVFALDETQSRRLLFWECPDPKIMRISNTIIGISIIIGLSFTLSSYGADLFGTEDRLLAAAIKSTDYWWQSVDNENPDFYEEVDLGKVIIHLAGSRKRLAEVHNSRYPDTPYDPNGHTYMFTGYGGKPPAHVWLVVKSRDKKVLLHKWATGHELVHVLRIFSGALEDAYKY